MNKPKSKTNHFFYSFKKNWHLIFGSLATITAFFILLVYTSSEKEPWINILQSAYNAFSLIILEGGNFSFPHHAPRSVQIILWICYFAAPLLTLTFIFRYMQDRFFANRIPKNLKNHIIICGLGRNGKIIYDLAQKEFTGKKIVIIEQNESNSYGDKLEKDAKTWWIKKDFTELPVLQKARVENAAQLYITTNDDLANISTLMNAVELSTNCRINCHIGDIRLYNNMEKVVEKASDFAKVALFNGYQMATQTLLHNKVKPNISRAETGNVYLFFGFGRFGQMLYNHIANEKLNPEKDEIIIVTLDQTMMEDDRNFTWSPEILKVLNPKKHYKDMNDIGLWDLIAKNLPEDKQISIFGCRDNDIANINLAISLMNNGPKKLKKGTFYCRTYSETSGKLQQILKQGITDDSSDDVILFPVYKELKDAFKNKLFTNT